MYTKYFYLSHKFQLNYFQIFNLLLLSLCYYQIYFVRLMELFIILL